MNGFKAVKITLESNRENISIMLISIGLCLKV